MSSGGHHILVVEDDHDLADLTADVLRSEGFITSVLYHGASAVQTVRETRPDMVILDVMLPGKDGFAICRECRGFYLGPVLMLTARGDDVDQILGLELGADDYVIKPVIPRVLIARIRALLRRSSAAPATQGDIDLGGIVIRTGERAVYAGSEEIALTSAEYDLLYYLAERRGMVIERDELYTELRGIPYDGIDRSIDLRVSRIRAAVRKVDPSAFPIHTVHGRGYMIRGITG